MEPDKTRAAAKKKNARSGLRTLIGLRWIGFARRFHVTIIF